ncbi:MAG TPA: HAMP domain-containing sensor histidine kinase [Longimicrobium sp.]|nr:HAMP domain-containing sensor histidine kinase [Longimicrobium sp.]
MAQETVAAPEPPGTPPAAEADPPAEAQPSGQAERRLAELRLLRDMAVAAADTGEPEEIFQILCGGLPGLMAADFALVGLPQLDAPREWCAAQEPSREAVARLVELLERARQEVRTIVAGRADGAELAGARAVPPPFGAATAIAVPLAGDATGGALLVGWHGERKVDAEAVRLAEIVAEQAGAAFRNAARYQALRQTAERRERFFSAMSHDLRTPITAIMGYSELLQDGIMGDLQPHQQDMVERICTVSGHLAQLVNDVLDIAKLDAGRMEFHREPVRLGDLVDEAVVAVQPQANSKSLEIRLEIDDQGDAVVDVDTGRVRQILVNLLSNAVKFTDAGAVTLQAGAEGARRWFRVLDTGPGIPPGSEAAVFEEFLQIAQGSKAKREPGSGLGLAISRRLARAMGGELTAANGDDGGAVFTLHLPEH